MANGMSLNNKLNIIDFAINAREEETHQQKKFVDWSKVDKEDYLLAMECSPIKDMEIKSVAKRCAFEQNLQP